MNQMTSLVAILISVAAMVVSIVEVAAVRDQQKAEVWPFIQVGPLYNSEGFALMASNKGVGPALVERLVLSVDGKPVDDLDQLIIDTVGAENAFSYDLYGTRDVTDEVLAPGESAALFRVPWETRTRLLVDRLGGRFEIDICYCSIHEDCWQVSVTEPRPESVRACDL